MAGFSPFSLPGCMHASMARSPIEVNNALYGPQLLAAGGKLVRLGRSLKHLRWSSGHFDLSGRIHWRNIPPCIFALSRAASARGSPGRPEAVETDRMVEKEGCAKRHVAETDIVARPRSAA